ncbi:MAG: arginine--tRNA ligase [Candidatus Thermoplasmatota archaeon]|nr:arginine--tRNA ligase [Candidatus Thermoplasmatota archaeon]
MQYPLEEALGEITTLIKSIIPDHKHSIKLETPPDQKMGDIAFPCFSLAPIYKKNPQNIAEDLASKVPSNTWVDHVKAQGGYLNFYLNSTKIVQTTLNEILTRKETYGHLELRHQKVIIEHTSANPNGPLHVGRARNPIIGDTLVRIFRAAGYMVDAQYYLDDMGKQVAILTWGIRHISKTEIPKPQYDKPDHRYVSYYQKAHKSMQEKHEVQNAISTIIKQSEKGDPATLDQIHSAYKPVLDGMITSLNRININIDSYVPESQFVLDKSADYVVNQLKKTPYSHEEDQALYLDLKAYGIQGRNTKFFYLRQDGTTLYATRDIAYHLWKAAHADRLINILGEDHKLESQQVAIALKLLHVTIIPEPVFYSFVSLPGGKMSTRRGRVVYLDDLIQESIARAYDEVKKRRGTELNETKMQMIAEMVGIGAIRYNIIKVQPEKDIVFRWEEALNFEGNAIPFIQYAHARACSILTKARIIPKKVDAQVVTHASEILLLKHLARFPITIKEACEGCKPHSIALYLYETASLFNQFYRDCPVLSVTETHILQARIGVVLATRIVLANALELLGIAAPEEM